MPGVLRDHEGGIPKGFALSQGIQQKKYRLLTGGILKEKFNIPVGFSDHTLGYHIPLAAIAIGATVIAKHFTIDKNLPGPDQSVSANPEEFSKIVEYGNKVYSAVKEKNT